jgi:cyclophilin family peptidyl-prolyl cis-trans isomerase
LRVVLRRLPLALALLLALSACGGSSNKSSSSTTTAPTTAPTATDAAGCVPVPRPDGKERTEKKPTSKLDPNKTYDVVIHTNCGDFTVRLAVKTAPNTTASFASLVGKGFYDGTVFHRIVPGFVIQGGDPTGNGTGGPGYATVDKPPPGTRYTHGVVAMAKTAAEPPGTGGSQFFVVTAPDAQLPPDYALLGKTVKGLDVVDKIGQLGDPATGGTGTPTETVAIQKATLTVH